MKTDKSALSRLGRAYPAAFKADAGRVKPLYEVSDRKSIMNHLQDVGGDPVSRAIMLAVMLDQYDSGEVVVEPELRERVAGMFEEAFQALAEAQA